MKFVALLVAIAVGLVSCSGSSVAPPPGSNTGGRVVVATSAFPIYDATAVIGGSRVHAINLRPVGALSDDRLTDKMTQQLEQADIAIILGRGVQPNIERIAARRRGPTIRLLETVATKPWLDTPAGPAPGVLNAPGPDPYIWLDTTRMAEITDQIHGALRSLDPAGGAGYRKRLRKYRRAIAGVDRNFSRDLAKCTRRDVLTTEPAFRYLTDRYRLAQVPVRPNAQGADGLGAASRSVSSTATVVFVPKLPELDEARSMIKRYDLRAAVLDPVVDQPDQARRGGSSYVSVMELNLDALVEGLSCDTPSSGK